jgi:hypothetical protein
LLVQVNRRQILALSATAAAVAMVGSGAALKAWWERAPGRGYRVIDDAEGAIVQALAGAAFPAGGEIDVDGSAMGLDHFFDELLGHMESTAAHELRILLRVLDAGPLLSHRSTFRALGAADRRAVLDAWLDDDLLEVRSASMGVLVLLGSGWALHPRVSAVFARWHQCGFGA